MSCFFFFKQKTAYEMLLCDWSSDVCSSDLARRAAREDGARRDARARRIGNARRGHPENRPDHLRDAQLGLRGALEHGRAEKGHSLRRDLEHPREAVYR